MKRLSVIILGHTALTFLGAWALFSYPELGDSQSDLGIQDATITHRASLAAQILAESLQPGERKDRGEKIRELFVIAAKGSPEVRRQAIYLIEEGGSSQLILDWEDDLGSGVRGLSADWETERRIATSLVRGAPGSVLRVTREDDGHRWAACFSSAPIRTNSDNPKDGALCVYEATIATIPPTANGANFAWSLLAFLFTSLLIALLIIQLLDSKLSAPLKQLQSAFNSLTSGDSERESPLLVEQCSGCAMSELISSFNRMSTTLFYQHRDLAIAHNQLTDAAAELSDSKTLLETVVESSPDAVIVADLHGEILFFNRAGREQFGYGDDEPAPTAISELFVRTEDNEVEIQWDFSERIRHERLGVRLDGTQFPTLIMTAPLRYDGATTNALLYVIRDISESQSFKDMMVRLDRLSIRGEMAGDVAHEINNYLAIIQGNTELLPALFKRGDEEKLKKRFGIISDTIARVSTFTEGLMNFEAQDSSFTSEYPNQLIHNLLAFLKPQKRLSNVRLELDLDNNIRTAQLSEGQFQQALVNLIYNSADALKECETVSEPTITIKSRLTDDSQLQLSVSDNGPGVKQEARAALFNERFTTKRKGHGIGLITCARIATAHSGTIRYEEAVGGGACFVLELPLHQPEQDTVIIGS